MTDHEALARQLEETGNYQVLRRLVPRWTYQVDATTAIRTAVALDVETTGLSPAQEKIIQLAMVRFEYGVDGTLRRVLDEYQGLEDPGKPIPPEMVELTGITDAMVAGQRLDDRLVVERMGAAHLVLAHNAAFDRSFFERRFPNLRGKPWACTMKDIPWREEGLGCRTLDYLGFQFGFFFDAHQARADCWAMIELLSRMLPKSGGGLLEALLQRARQTTGLIWALDSPYEHKDELRDRGYRWNSGENGRPRAWYIELPEAEINDELAFLTRLGAQPTVTKVDATNRYAEAEVAG